MGGVDPQGGEGGVVEHQVTADWVVVAPAEAGQYGLAIRCFGHVDGLLAELVVPEARFRLLGFRVGQALGRRGGPQDGQRFLVEG